MTRHTIPFTAMILCVAHAAAAQLPPRTPAEPSQSVTLSLSNTTASSIARARPFRRRRRRRWRPCFRTPSCLSASTAQLRAAHSRWPAMSCGQA